MFNWKNFWVELSIDSFGRKRGHFDLISKHDWNFSNLEDAFKEGGVLHTENAFKEIGVTEMERFYLFVCAESHLLAFNGQWKQTWIPVVVVIVSPFAPSNKVGIIRSEHLKEYNQFKMKLKEYIDKEHIDMEHIDMDKSGCQKLMDMYKSVFKEMMAEPIYMDDSEQMEAEELTDMENAYVAWLPYVQIVPWWDFPVESCDYLLFVLSHCRSGLCGGFPDPQYCVPYFNNPFKEDEITVVDIIYSFEAKPVRYEYNWELDEPEEFTNVLITMDLLPSDHKDSFKELVKEKVEEAKRANPEALRKRMQAQEESRTQGKDAAAFEKMRFYKFYPVATPDTPDVSGFKSQFINKYYGNAHQVF